MENNELMVNEEVVETVEEAVLDSGKGWKMVAGVGLAVLVGVGVYKIGKKIAANIKAKKEKERELADGEIVCEDVEYSEEA